MVIAWGSRPNAAVLPRTRHQTAMCNKVIFWFLYSPRTLLLESTACRVMVPQRQVRSRGARWDIDSLSETWASSWSLIWKDSVDGFSSPWHIDSDTLESGYPFTGHQVSIQSIQPNGTKNHKPLPLTNYKPAYSYLLKMYSATRLCVF